MRIDELLRRLRSHDARRCLEDGEHAYSYAQLLHEIELWRMRVTAASVGPGSVVGVRADYCMSAIAALIALMLMRASVVLIPREGDVSRHLADACTGAMLDIETDGSYRWQHIESPPRHPLLERLHAAGESGIVIFTSGSTGYPKAALHSVAGFLSKFGKPGRCLRTLAFLLFDHVAGLDTLFYTLSSGGCLIVTRRRDPHSIVRLIESHGVEVLPASPSFLRLLCAAALPARDLSSLKVITYGSEPMDPTTLARLNERFPELQIVQKYGTTETGSPRTVSRGNDSLWLKIKREGVETKIVDGVLWIRSESTIMGYLNAPSPVDEAGWYCTGDLVDVDGEWIRFRGRIADTIKVGGEKVAPAEVEQIIMELEFVSEALVCGEPHPLMGQVVAARVALRAPLDAKEAAREIRAHCRRRLPAYKVPLRVEIATAGFVTARQKAQRSASWG